MTITSPSLNAGVPSCPYDSFVSVTPQGGKDMRYIALIALALALAACGGGSSASHPSASPSSSAVPGLSSAQGKSICQDIAA